MIDRTKFNPVIRELKKISDRYALDGFRIALEALERYIENFNINVLVVGHFNAGKSSLLNKFIGVDDLLLEDDKPTTAIATEVCYTDGVPRYVGVKEDDSMQNITPETKDNLSGFKKVIFYVPSPNLKQYPDYTFVDTPGFDSNIEAHNNALRNYICNGSIFIHVMDGETGDLTMEDLDFFNEMANYSEYISIIVNKADHATGADLVVEKCKSTLEMRGWNIPVIKGSKWFENAEQIIPQAIENFDAQSIFDEHIKMQIRLTATTYLDAIRAAKEAANLNNFEYDSKIHDLTNSLEFLNRQFESKKEEMANSMGEMAVQRILENVQGALSAEEESLIAALLHGSEAAAEAVILEAVRPAVINSLKEVTANHVGSMLADLSMGLENIAKPEEISGTIQSLSQNAQNFIANGSLQKIETGVAKLAEKMNSKQGSNAYKNITGLLAILTDIVNPALEAVIVFMPDIINLIKKAFCKSEKQLIREHIQAVIYPQVRSMLHSKLSTVVSQQYERLIEILQDQVNERITCIKDQLEIVNKEKKENSERYYELVEDMSRDSKKLEAIIVEAEG